MISSALAISIKLARSYRLETVAVPGPPFSLGAGLIRKPGKPRPGGDGCNRSHRSIPGSRNARHDAGNGGTPGHSSGYSGRNPASSRYGGAAEFQC